jgi:hypothetical protein
VRNVSILDTYNQFACEAELKQFRELSLDELPAGIKSGVAFDTVSINPHVYLPWLKSELDKKGVHFIRQKIHSLDEVPTLVGEGTIVVNATSLGAYVEATLSDVLNRHSRRTIPTWRRGHQHVPHSRTGHRSASSRDHHLPHD